MADIIKPAHLSKTWAKLGEKIEPSDTKKNQGWVEEIPTFQDFNWVMNRQDTAIAHNNMHGIPVWDSTTEYQAGTSLATGSNGYIYSCKVTNTNNDPVLDTVGINWTIALIPTRRSKPSAVVTTTSSWGNLGAALTANISDGILYVNGNLTGGTTTNDTTVATLPSGYAPAASRFCGSVFQTGVYTYGSCSLEVNSSGAIKIRGVTANTNLYISIAVPL
jgi:hypothetical protein